MFWFTTSIVKLVSPCPTGLIFSINLAGGNLQPVATTLIPNGAFCSASEYWISKNVLSNFENSFYSISNFLKITALNSFITVAIKKFVFCHEQHFEKKINSVPCVGALFQLCAKNINMDSSRLSSSCFSMTNDRNSSFKISLKNILHALKGSKRIPSWFHAVETW